MAGHTDIILILAERYPLYDSTYRIENLCFTYIYFLDIKILRMKLSFHILTAVTSPEIIYLSLIVIANEFT